jgi:glycosyltransferase involved in cell wall biosynthesis
MKILIINQYAVPTSQPGLTRHFMLARELVKRGHEATIMATSFNHVTRTETRLEDDENSKVETIDGVRFLWLRTPSYRGNSTARIKNMFMFAWRVWRSDVIRLFGRPDIVIGSSPHLLASLAALRVAKRAGAPYVFEVRDLWPETLVHLGGMPRRHPVVVVLGWIERLLYLRANRIVTLLPAAQDYISQHGGSRDKITWIPNGIDLSLQPAARGSNQGIERGTFEVVYSGTHGFANALDSILDAAALLRNVTTPDIRFRFVGDGPAKENLEKRVREEGISNVSFQDAVPKDVVPLVLASADVLIATLKDKPLYGYGISLNKINDYMAAGIPIVFGSHGVDDPVTRAQAGIVVPPENAQAMAEAVLSLARLTPQERNAIGARGRDYVKKNHDLGGLADVFERLLQSTLSLPTGDGQTGLQTVGPH